MKCAINAQSAQSHLGNNKTLSQLKVCIVMAIYNMEKVVVLNMLIANFSKYFNNCTDCGFHKFALIALFALNALFALIALIALFALFALIAHFITFFVASLGARNVTEDL